MLIKVFFFLNIYLLNTSFVFSGIWQWAKRGSLFCLLKELTIWENVNRRKKLYSEIVYHVVFQELTKQTQFSREKCHLKLLKSSMSSSWPACCAREGQLEKRLSMFAWPREASAQCIILGRARAWGRVEEPAGGVWLAVLRVVCLHFLCSSR